MTRAPIPNCPQPETPIRDRAWTDGQLAVQTANQLARAVSDADVEDAARYRWLRDQHNSMARSWHVRTISNDIPDELDQNIDAARKGERHE